jgi:hypothetical protein
MQRVGFGDLPWIVRIVLGLAVLNLWVSFEEFVIDRLGIWRYLPGYKFGRLCVWDLTVAIGIAFMIWRLGKNETKCNSVNSCIIMWRYWELQRWPL